MLGIKFVKIIVKLKEIIVISAPVTILYDVLGMNDIKILIIRYAA